MEKKYVKSFDLAIIGGGPGGYVCAIKAAQLGLSVALFEQEKLGGTCLNKGCIPTKSFLESAKLVNSIKRAEEFGILHEMQSLNFENIIFRAQKIVSKLNNGVASLVAKNKINLFNCAAKFKDKNTLLTDDQTEIVAKNIVIATGAVSRMLPDIEDNLLKSGLILTSKETIALVELPKKILIIGSGAIGIEFASFYHMLGVEVTVVEIKDRILVLEDCDVSKSMLNILSQKGIKFLLNTKTQNFCEKDGRLAVDIVDSDDDIKNKIFDLAIVAIGVEPNTKSLNLEDVGILVNETGNIIVDKFQKTNIEGIYAIGDVAEPPFLAHKASREGIIVAEKIAGKDILPYNRAAIPSCVYSCPQIASIGMTEEEACIKNISIKIGRAKFSTNGKALASGASEGFVKVIFAEQTGELLGAHMVGHEVSELIAIFSLAITGELTEREIMATVFPHPTMSEVVWEAIADAYGVAIHA